MNIVRNRRSILPFVLLIGAVLLTGGCSTLGPQSLKGNRIDYNVSIHRSNNEDLLVNIVRASCFEPLFFLQVGSVSSSFNYGATVGASGTLYETRSASYANMLGASLGASFSEVPTITYAPLQGQQAMKQLMSETPIDRIYLLARGGWSIASLMWIIVQQIGPLYNYDADWKEDHPLVGSYMKFIELTDIWSQMQRRGELEFPGLDKDKHDLPIVPVQMVFKNVQDADRVDRLLGVQTVKTSMPDGRLKSRINLSGRCDTGVTNCVPLRLRSFFGIIYDFASLGVEQKQAFPWRQLPPRELEGRLGTHQGLIKIRTSAVAPAEAYVAVHYRGIWYYIDDNDLVSRGYFTLIGTLFALQPVDAPMAQPLLTLPVVR